MANRLLRQKVGLGAIAAAVGLWAPAAVTNELRLAGMGA